MGKINVGDSCWVWNSQAHWNTGTIERGVVVEADANFCRVRLKGRDRPYVFLTCEVFPTRRALCEHYRKVFE